MFSMRRPGIHCGIGSARAGRRMGSFSAVIMSAGTRIVGSAICRASSQFRSSARYQLNDPRVPVRANART